MRLGLAEIRRTPAKFAAVAGAVGFIVFLALILAALSDGLYLGSTGAFRSTPADVFVLSPGSDMELSGSAIADDEAGLVGGLEGVQEVGRLSSFNTTATWNGEDLQLTLVGADQATMPSVVLEGRRPEPGTWEVLVDQQVEQRGIGVGSAISMNDGPDLEVVGVAKDAGFGFTTAWAPHDAFAQARAEVRPELASLYGTSQALGVVLANQEAVAVIQESTDLLVATPQEVIEALPAASQQKTTLDGIVYTTFAVAAIVVGLFFALVTLEKRNEYAVLKAIGLSGRSLVAAVFAQAVIASIVGFASGFGLSRLAGLIIPGDIPTLFLGRTALTLFVVTLVMGSLGAVFSFRRVVTIDPASALGGTI